MDDIEVISERYQDDAPETETETKTKGEVERKKEEKEKKKSRKRLALRALVSLNLMTFQTRLGQTG